jgi:hypothetical protein
MRTTNVRVASPGDDLLEPLLENSSLDEEVGMG